MPKNTQDIENDELEADELDEETSEADDDVIGEEPDPVIKLTAAVNTASATLAEAQAALQTAAASNDLKAMLAAADTLKAAERNREKAQNALDAATFELKAEERMAFSLGVKEGLEAYIAENVDLVRFAELGLKVIRIDVDPDNPTSPLVSVVTPEKAKAARTSATREPGASRGKSAWHYNGSTYTSAELLEQFGGEAGAKAIDKARNYKEYGLKFSPGFDSEVKKLAKELGATRDE